MVYLLNGRTGRVVERKVTDLQIPIISPVNHPLNNSVKHSETGLNSLEDKVQEKLVPSGSTSSDELANCILGKNQLKSTLTCPPDFEDLIVFLGPQDCGSPEKQFNFGSSKESNRQVLPESLPDVLNSILSGEAGGIHPLTQSAMSSDKQLHMQKFLDSIPVVGNFIDEDEQATEVDSQCSPNMLSPLEEEGLMDNHCTPGSQELQPLPAENIAHERILPVAVSPPAQSPALPDNGLTPGGRPRIHRGTGARAKNHKWNKHCYDRLGKTGKFAKKGDKSVNIF